MSDGNGCKCAAYSESECCCEGVDWTPQAWIDDKALIESQAVQIEQLRAEVAESDALREKLATLLAETSVALKGKEAALHRHSWHDLPVIALEKMVTIEQLRTLCDQLAGQLTVAMAYVPIGGYGYDDCDSALSAWRQRKGEPK